MQYSRFLLAALLFTLASCAGVDRQIDITPGASASIDAWHVDSDSMTAAVRQLVGRADSQISAGRLVDAEAVLNRSLRINNRVASVWSRLAWLSAEQHSHRRVQDYVSKSNSLTSDNALLRFNWQLYYQSSLVLGDSGALELARKQLESLH